MEKNTYILFYYTKVVRFLKISLGTEPIEFSIVRKFHLGNRMAQNGCMLFFHGFKSKGGFMLFLWGIR